MAYHGYGAAPGGFPPAQQDPLYGYFAAVAGQDGQISADELQRCLTQSGMSGSYKPFSLETCRLMISMLDRDYSGTMGFNEFKELGQVLTGWRNVFASYDRDHSGTVEAHELQQAIAGLGYNLSPQAMNIIMKRFSLNGRIPFDEFVSCCVKLRALTDQFRRRDHSQTGQASFGYDDLVGSTDHSEPVEFGTVETVKQFIQVTINI